MFEFVVSVVLRDELSIDDVAELRWHLGLGELPECGPRIGGGVCRVAEDEDGELVTLDPEPLLGAHGPAWKIGGMLGASLERSTTGWRLDARQEMHAEMLEESTELMRWLYRRVEADFVRADGSVEIARMRWYEDTESTALVVRDDQLYWPWPTTP